jgi:serine/threonine protein kinase
VITGKLYIGPEVDVWSCGVILFALLCGRLPFDDDSIVELFKMINNCEYSFPDHVSPQAKDLISKILVVNPLKRASIKDIKNHKWFQVNLPEYLRISISTSLTIDEDVLKEALSVC